MFFQRGDGGFNESFLFGCHRSIEADGRKVSEREMLCLLALHGAGSAHVLPHGGRTPVADGAGSVGIDH